MKLKTGGLVFIFLCTNTTIIYLRKNFLKNECASLRKIKVVIYLISDPGLRREEYKYYTALPGVQI